MMQVLVFDPLSHIGNTLHNVLGGMSAPVDASLARDWAEVRSKAAQQPTVVILGPNVPQSDLPNAARIGEEARNSAFILVTDELDSQSLQTAMRNGIRDVVAVHDVQVDLVSAVERARSLLDSSGGEPASSGRRQREDRRRVRAQGGHRQDHGGNEPRDIECKGRYQYVAAGCEPHLRRLRLIPTSASGKDPRRHSGAWR